MTTAVGFIPLPTVCTVTGGHIASKGFRQAAGSVPVCWEHWGDDDWTATHAAAYQVGRDGIMVIHELDESNERGIIEAIKAGRLYFSYGAQASPEAARAALTHHADQVATGRRIYAGRSEPMTSIRHWAYTERPALPQEPILLVG